MTRGSKGDGKHLGPGAKGKGAGTGAMTDVQSDLIGDTWCFPTATKPSTPEIGAKTVSGPKPNN